MHDSVMSESFRFCPLCASGLKPVADGGRTRPTCEQCGFVHYSNPTPAAGCLVRRDGAILLVRRAVTPRRGDWTLPAGFVEYDESAAECAAREVAEETGLAVRVGGLLGVYPGNDDPRHPVVLIIYHADESGEGVLRPGDDADDARFFKPDDVPNNIAFRAHRQALADALDGSGLDPAGQTRSRADR